MTSKYDEIKHYLERSDCDVVALTEARITTDIANDEIQVEGYNTIRCNSESRYTGGTVCYIKKGYDVTNVKDIALERALWISSFKLDNSLYVVVYRSPNSSINDFLSEFEIIIEDLIKTKAENYCIMGDFNIDVRSNSIYTDALINMMKCFGLFQKVREYTRITKDSGSTIDLVFTNREDVKISVLRSPKISDHDLIEIVVNTKTNTYLPKTITFRNKSNLKNVNFEYMLQDRYWPDGENVNVTLSNFYKNVTEVMDAIAPIQTRIVDRPRNGWFDDELRESIKQRDYLYKKACFVKNIEYWSAYTSKRNKVTNMIRLKKREYYEQVIDRNRHNPKKMWKAIKLVVGHARGDVGIDVVEYRNKNFHVTSEIAEIFNTYFINSIEEIVVNSTYGINYQNLHTNANVVPLLEFKLITVEDLNAIMKNIRKNSSVDDVDMRILLAGGNTVRNLLTTIINKSFEENTVPNSWKISTVAPVPKVINTNKVEEYRPINMLPLCEKIMEIQVKHQLAEHLQLNKILIEQQSGFREKHSCESALQLVLAQWKESIDEGKSVVAVFLDLKRAFETLDRDILIKKLEYYGVKDGANKWFKSYLRDRYQCTKVGSVISKKKSVNYGVPQGSVLGPLLFLIYINDIKSCISDDVLLNLFADDTLLSVHGENLEETILKLQLELNKLERWLEENKLFVNTKKTKVMILGNINNASNKKLKLFNVDLDYVTEYKYLGIVIDCKLTFRNHMNYTISKISKKVGYFRRISQNLSLRSRTLVYKTIIAPLFEYCPTILYFANSTDKNSLQKLQNRAMRVILHTNRYAHIADMLQTLHFMTINQRLSMLNMLFIFKILHGLLPNYMLKRIKFVQEVHHYNTRSASNIFVPTAKKSSTQKSLFYAGLVEYNAIPLYIRSVNTIREFKRLLVVYVREHF